MVGVPRSTGCSLCIKRRVKCDSLQPACSQCQKYGVHCPGYAKARKFMDEGPLIKKRYARSGNPLSLQEAQKVQQDHRSPANFIGDQLFPSLISKSMTRQQPEIFRDFVLTAFPCWFGLNKYRVHVPWAAYVANVLGQNPTLDAAVFCITSVFLGRSHHDSTLQKSSREMYSKALVSLGGIIKHEEIMRSRESVSTSILLSLFEAYSQTKEDSWVQHASGAALLMSLRGAKSHLTGFDRCLYLSFRSFLVAAAFIEGKPCFFEKSEWQALISGIRAQDMVDPRASGTLSTLIDRTDLLFMEVVKIPGLMFHANQHLHAMPRKPPAETDALITRIHHCKEIIQNLSGEIQLAAASGAYKNTDDRMVFIGPIPPNLPQSFSSGVLRGTSNCFRILDILLHNLAIYHREVFLPCSSDDSPLESPFSSFSSSSSPRSSTDSLQDPISLGLSGLISFRIVSKRQSRKDDDCFVPPGGRNLCPVDKWLDQVASSMGMEAFEVVIDE